MTEIQFFEVGGCVRDEIMGRTPKDIDFSVIAPTFDFMRGAIMDTGMKIVQEKPEFGTIRAVAKRPFMGHSGGLDFVWARIDGPSSDGRRPDWTRPGTLLDDLSRRDLTMNAIAKDEFGNLIDPFDGIGDIERSLIRCVGSAEDRIFEDALRGLRAIRFAVTLGFRMDVDIDCVLVSDEFSEALSSVSKERQREEIEKMFAHDTVASLQMMNRFPALTRAVFEGGLRLSATMKA